MPTKPARDQLWSTLVEFAADHAQPEHASCRLNPEHCRLQADLSLQFDNLVAAEPIEDLIEWAVGHVIREGTAIAHTRKDDGGIPLAGFRFDGSSAAGILAGAFMMSNAHHHDDLAAAARTILHFAPPATGQSVFGVLIEQLVGSLVERHQQMSGQKTDT